MNVDKWNDRARDEIDSLADDSTEWDTNTGVHLLNEIRPTPWQVVVGYLRGLPLFVQIFLTLAIGGLLITIAVEKLSK